MLITVTVPCIVPHTHLSYDTIGITSIYAGESIADAANAIYEHRMPDGTHVDVTGVDADTRYETQRAVWAEFELRESIGF